MCRYLDDYDLRCCLMYPNVMRITTVKRFVFFELNGEPRSFKIADRSKVTAKPSRREAGAADHKNVIEPTPNTAATAHVKPNAKVSVGDVLVTI